MEQTKAVNFIPFLILILILIHIIENAIAFIAFRCHRASSGFTRCPSIFLE